MPQLTWDSTYTDTLPEDPNRTARTRPRQVDAVFSLGTIRQSSDPNVVVVSRDTVDLLGLADHFDGMAEVQLAQLLSGNEKLPGAPSPWCSNYGGHQFGSWSGQLGDGRAITLGHMRTPSDGPWELQLKGAGQTPYSRESDGLAVLRSSLREYLASEAMRALGIPTTRVLSLVTTGDMVARDEFYDGRWREEPGAVVCRVARSFVRFGSFQLPASRGQTEIVKKLAVYCAKLEGGGSSGHATDAEQQLAGWLAQVVARNARLAAQWWAIGFVHGVLNTDNMSVLGETIDYGPYGWLEGFSLEYTPNTSDTGGRYCFKNQPAAVLWNCVQLAKSMHGVVSQDDMQHAIDSFSSEFSKEYESRMSLRLGLGGAWSDERGDGALLQQWLGLLAENELDYTNSFRALSHAYPTSATCFEATEVQTQQAQLALELLREALGEAFPAMGSTASQEWIVWLQRWLVRATDGATTVAEREARKALMLRSNPKFILRNWMAHRAIEACTSGDSTELHRLLALLSEPFEEHPSMACPDDTESEPAWSKNALGISLLS